MSNHQFPNDDQPEHRSPTSTSGRQSILKSNSSSSNPKERARVEEDLGEISPLTLVSPYFNEWQFTPGKQKQKDTDAGADACSGTCPSCITQRGFARAMTSLFFVREDKDKA